jgi:hypothetical protein
MKNVTSPIRGDLFVARVREGIDRHPGIRPPVKSTCSLAPSGVPYL